MAGPATSERARGPMEARCTAVVRVCEACFIAMTNRIACSGIAWNRDAYQQAAMLNDALAMSSLFLSSPSRCRSHTQDRSLGRLGRPGQFARNQVQEAGLHFHGIGAIRREEERDGKAFLGVACPIGNCIGLRGHHGSGPVALG